MDRLIAILLMPLFVVGNALAHAHGTAAHASPGEGRAHFHVGSASQHGHHHHGSHGHANHDHHDHEGHHHESDEPESSPVTPVEHDSDAVYIIAADFVFIACDRIFIEIDAQAFVGTVVHLLTNFRQSALCDPRQLATTIQLPLYLLHAALRL